MVCRKYFYGFLAAFFCLNVVSLHVINPLYPIEEQETQIVFWNVGQGNCTLIKTPEFDRDGDLLRRHITLIDAGTNTLPVNPQTNEKILGRHKEEKFSELIGREIVNYFNDGDTELYFRGIFSHPDEDHINLSKNIIDFVANENSAFLENAGFYFGSREEVWKSHSNTSRKVLECIEKIEEDHLTVSFSGVENNDFALQDEVVDFGNNNCLDFLFGQNLNTPLGESNNQESLVVRYRFGNISALIPGDATAETGEAIFENALSKQKLPEDLKVNILLASHHGARKERCNSRAWARRFQPQHVIFSTSGRAKGDTKHPQARALANYFFDPNQRLVRTDLNHPISFFGEDNKLFTSGFLESLIPQESGSYLADTSYSLYSTAMSGDIVCTWGHTTNPEALNIEPERKPIIFGDEKS